MPDFSIQQFKTLHALIIVTWRTLVFRSMSKLRLNNVILGKGVRANQRVTALGKGRIEIGDGTHLGVYPSPGFKRGEFYLEARHQESKIIIGKNVYINNGAVIIADKSTITIGDNTLIGPNFVCFDSNFHSLKPDKRLSSDYSCMPVVIGKNVFIGEGVKVLKGGNVLCDDVIGAGEIIRKTNSVK